jgi:ABC-type oligopeptide transport system substrate-binding subunit
VVRVGIPGPKSLDSVNIVEGPVMEIGRLLYQSLTGLDDESRPVPAAAESWANSDHTEWTFRLRPATFHNGEPVTAESFVAAFHHLADPTVEAEGAFLGVEAGIEGFAAVATGDADRIVGVQALDEATLRIRLSSPNSLLPALLAHPAFAPRAPAAIADPDSHQQHPIGNGSYAMVASWTEGSTIALAPFPAFAEPDGDAHSHRFRFVTFNSPEDMYADRSLDITYVPESELVSLRRQSARDRLVEAPVTSYNYIAFPLDKAPFDDPRIRRALSLAIDRDALVAEVFGTARLPATGFAPGGSLASSPDDCRYCEHDVLEARKLVRAAGGFPGGVVELAFNDDRNHADWMQALGQQWADAFEIEVRFVSDGTVPYLAAARSGAFDGPFRLRWSGDYPHAMAFIAPLFIGEDAVTKGYSNPGLEAEAEQLWTMDDPFGEEATDLVAAMTDRLSEDMPIIPIFTEAAHRLHSERVSDVRLLIDGSLRLEHLTLTE